MLAAPACTTAQSSREGSLSAAQPDWRNLPPSSPLRLPRLIWRSAPSFSSSDHRREILGRPHEVLAVLVLQRAWARRRRRLAATHRVQEAWRNAIARRLGLVRRVAIKSSAAQRLGVTFDSSWSRHAVVSTLKPGAAVRGILRVNDRVVRINGSRCDGRTPSATAQALKAQVGRIHLMLAPASQFDPAILAERERAARRERAERALAASPECAICLSTLSEPVFWPGPGGGCDHLYCRPCLRKWASSARAQRRTPLCPLCRAPAKSGARVGDELEIDEDAEELLRLAGLGAE